MRALELKVPPTALVVLIAAAMFALSRAWPSMAVAVPARVVLAALLLLVGIAIALAGVAAFRRVRTTVNPIRPDTSSAVVSTGIYARSRNPMYLGMLLALAAWAVWLSHPLAFLGLPVFVLWMNAFQIRPEERALADRFGPVYQDYLRSVRRWI
ncbi:isoprenylcysteine carboxylmethyltransferase family protein [Ramlibacter rhizophilus]|uniref:Isoprenylcysteine carboxylmethyltransferase family protein n=2 Tax=Ramlibacter rhizophilus TaxID=1781167 RepID=A0A4Z0BDV5_9BURK|nr:isoprenylcysteine carboxylmethyltransferase family protein [Ramlibacter rhizophilus]